MKCLLARSRSGRAVWGQSNPAAQIDIVLAAEKMQLAIGRKKENALWPTDSALRLGWKYCNDSEGTVHTGLRPCYIEFFAS